MAPVLTIIIGGNHEASNILQNLYYGGWIAPNIYFLGYAGVVTINNSIKIGGLSGIYNAGHYHNTHYEMPPYSPDSLRSVYHVRELEIFRLAQYTAQYPQSIEAVCGSSRYQRSPIDVFLSHDWPQHIWEFGDLNYLLKVKPYFRQDIETNQLGNPALMQQVLKRLRPRYWFAAHLHVKFAAVVTHLDADDSHQSTMEMTGMFNSDSVAGKRKFGELAASNINTSGSFDTIFEDENGDDGDASLGYNAVARTEAGVYCGEVGKRRGNDEPIKPNRITRFLALDKIHAAGGGSGRGSGRDGRGGRGGGDRGGFLQFLTIPIAHGRRRQLLTTMGQDTDAEWEAAANSLPVPRQGPASVAVSADSNELDISMNEDEGPEQPVAETVKNNVRPPPPPGPPPTASEPVTLTYDLEWLAILRKTHHLLSSEGVSVDNVHRVSGVNTQRRVRMPSQFPVVTDEDIEAVYQRFVECRGGSLVIPPLQVSTHTAACAAPVSALSTSTSVSSSSSCYSLSTDDTTLPISFGSTHGGRRPVFTQQNRHQQLPKSGQSQYPNDSRSYYGPSPAANSTAPSNSFCPGSYELGNRQTDELLDLLQLPHIWTRRCPDGNAHTVSSSSSVDGANRMNVQVTVAHSDKGLLVPSQITRSRVAGAGIPNLPSTAPPPPLTNHVGTVMTAASADDNELDIDEL